MILIGTFFMSLFMSCEEKDDNAISSFLAEVKGYDNNCSSCILVLPDESSEILKELGESEKNYYHAVNLNKEDFFIGQRLYVQARKAQSDEINTCKGHVNNNYKNIYITSYELVFNLFLNDTLTIKTNECLVNTEEMISICMDSVTSDSRCPGGVICFWEGEASVRFHTFVDNEVMSFILSCHPFFRNDTLIDGYNFSLINVSPYPIFDNPIEKEDYSAQILVTKE